MKHSGCAYITANQYNTVLYTGVTAELRARIYEHKTKFYPKCWKDLWEKHSGFIK